MTISPHPSHTPLAERMRPTTLDQIIGQKHLLGDNAPISRLLAQKKLPSIILYGEAGIGKTTLAELLAKKSGLVFKKISAVHSGVKELKEAMTSDFGLFYESPLVFIDEIHRFNKAQQDALLGAVESGQIILIGATTENPSFSINHALLSRCQVYRLHPLSDDEIVQLLQNAISKDPILKSKNTVIFEHDALVHLACGDGRRALNLLELAALISDDGKITNALTASVAGACPVRYDKNGDHHYQLISAFIKSVRGSDADAAVYYLARMLVAGEDAAFIARRLVILASEDIGLANPNALLLADTALRSVQAIGMPEARIVLSQVAIYLATSPKSNSSYQAINHAMDFVKHDQSDVPNHLKNANSTLAKQQGHGANYHYPHEYPNHYYQQDYLPQHLDGQTFYHFADNPKEQAAKQYIDWLKNQPSHSF